MKSSPIIKMVKAYNQNHISMLKRFQLLNERHAEGDNKDPLEPTACNSA
jgi:hypothetical protein